MCWSKAIRASAARGSPWPPVAMIITSLARQPHRLVEIDRLRKISEIADALRNPQDAIEAAAGDADLAARVLRDMAQRLEAGGVGGEGGDQHPALLRPGSTSSRPWRTPSSEPDDASWKTLVESQTKASTPASPIARSSASVEGSPSCGVSSSFQSPVWKTRP